MFLEKPFIIENQNPDICGPCGGKCCKKLPGIVHPYDIEMSEEYLTHLITEKGYQIDCWESNPFDDGREIGQVFYLRPQTINARNEVFNFSWGGQCVFLEDTGCTLSWGERPAQCRALVPKANNMCSNDDPKMSKKELAKAWFPHSEFLRTVGYNIENSL
jgi:Fe-S-cluster containining protein